MPPALVLPRMLCTVVPLVRRQWHALIRSVIDELVALPFRKSVRSSFNSPAWRRPGFAAVVGALDNLAEPAARLRYINPIRVNGRALHVVDLPSREMRTAYFPVLSLAV